jgi:hypothetical protein
MSADVAEVLCQLAPMRVLPSMGRALDEYARVAEERGAEARARYEGFRDSLRSVGRDGLLHAGSWHREPSGRIHFLPQTVANALRVHIGPSEEGRRFIDADYSAAHLTIAGVRSGDAALQEGLAGGRCYEDLAAEVLPSLDPALGRKTVKRLALSQINGGSVKTVREQLARIVDAPARVAEAFVKAWKARYPDLQQYIRAVLREAERAGDVFEVRTLTGRVVKIPVAGGRALAGLSAQWSSVEAEALDWVLERFDERLGSLGARLVLPMFDGLLLDAPASAAAQVAEAASRLMVEAMAAVGVPGALVKTEIRGRWGEGEIPEEPPPPGDTDAPSEGGEEAERRQEEADAAVRALQLIIGRLKGAPTRALRKPVTEELFAPKLIDGLAKAFNIDAVVVLSEIESVRTVESGAADRLQKLVERRARALIDVARAARAAANEERFKTQPDVAESLGELAATANIPCALRMPFRYAIDAQGVWSVKVRQLPSGEIQEELTRICTRPLFVVGVDVDVDDGTQTLLVQWYGAGGWQTRQVPRRVAQVARHLAEQAEFGLPVSSESARDVVAYIEAFLAENESHLPKRKTTTVLGWREGGFTWGTTFIGVDGPVADPPVRMAEIDPGLRQFVIGYRTSGTWEGWCAAIEQISRYPAAMIAVLAAMGPPLLRHLPGVGNPVVDWAGSTSQGKTTVLRVGASVWGYPNDRDNGLIRPWNATRAFIERYANINADLPLFLDDTKAVHDASVIGNVLYMFAQGQGRGRGSVDGVRASNTWRSVLLSTGEAPATSYTKAGGANARCFVLWGSPFGGQSAEGGQLAEQVTLALLENHGHLGPRLVQWLQGEGRIAWLKERFRGAHEEWGRLAGGDAVVRRGLTTIALLQVCEDICRELGVPRCKTNALWELWKAIVHSAEKADKASEALREVYAHACANQMAFIGRHIVKLDDSNTQNQETRAPYRGWLGVWDKDEGWPFLAFLPNALKDLLEERGYDADAIVRTWLDRGWLQRFRKKGGKPEPTYPTRQGTGRSAPQPRHYRILRRAVDLVEGVYDDETAGRVTAELEKAGGLFTDAA